MMTKTFQYDQSATYLSYYEYFESLNIFVVINFKSLCSEFMPEKNLLKGVSITDLIVG